MAEKESFTKILSKKYGMDCDEDDNVAYKYDVAKNGIMLYQSLMKELKQKMQKTDKNDNTHNCVLDINLVDFICARLKTIDAKTAKRLANDVYGDFLILLFTQDDDFSTISLQTRDSANVDIANHDMNVDWGTRYNEYVKNTKEAMNHRLIGDEVGIYVFSYEKNGETHLYFDWSAYVMHLEYEALNNTDIELPEDGE